MRKKWFIQDFFKKNKAIDRFSFGHFCFGLNLCVYLTLFSQLFLDYHIGIVFCIVYGFIAIVGWEVIEHTIFKKYIYSEGFHESIWNIIMDIIIGYSSCFLLFTFIYILSYSIITTLVSFFFGNILIGYSIYIIEYTKKE